MQWIAQYHFRRPDDTYDPDIYTVHRTQPQGDRTECGLKWGHSGPYKGSASGPDWGAGSPRDTKHLCPTCVKISRQQGFILP